MPRGCHTALTITLTPDDRQTLLAWQHSAKIPDRRARHGRMLLLLAEGMTVIAVAQRVGMTRLSVYLWAQRFLQHGIAGPADQPGRGRRPRLTTPARGEQASRRQQDAESQQAGR